MIKRFSALDTGIMINGVEIPFFPVSEILIDETIDPLSGKKDIVIDANVLVKALSDTALKDLSKLIANESRERRQKHERCGYCGSISCGCGEVL